MPVFQYKALDQAHQDIKGELTADTADAALAEIRRRGLFPTSLKEVGKQKRTARPAAAAQPVEDDAYRPQQKYWFGVSRKSLIRFTFQFAQMQEAGLTILASLKTLGKQLGPGLLGRTIRSVTRDIEGGETLAEALAKHPRVFDELYVKMVSVGETTGDLDKILSSIATAKEKILKLRRKIIMMSIYPAFVVCFSIGFILFFKFYLLPIIRSTVMSQTGNAMPAGGILNTIDWLLSGSWVTWVTGAAILFVLHRLLNSIEPGRFLLDLSKLKIPLFGRLFYKVCVARVARILGTLIRAGVPILDSLKITRDVAGNQVFYRTLTDIRKSVREGTELTTCLKNGRLFDPVAINMVEVGEETGDLDKTLLKLADIYEDDVDTHVSYLVGLLEPTLIVLMCVIVGGMILSFAGMIYGSLLNQ